jgi:hypothetical protein
MATTIPGIRTFGGDFSKMGSAAQIPRFDPKQQQAILQILQMALSGLRPGQFGAQFEPIAQEARTQFEQRGIPSIAERFTALGGEGGQRSAAFTQSLGQAQAGLEQGLASEKARFGLAQQSILSQLLGQGLTPFYETALQGKGPGFFSSVGQGLGQGAGLLAGLAAKAYLGI